MSIRDIVLYILTIISFIITYKGIVHSKKHVAAVGVISMAVLTGLSFYLG